MKRYYLLLILLIFCLLHACSPKRPKVSASDWKTIVLEHKALYPEIQIQDIYKLVYQSIFGPGHMGTDESQIAKWLNEELSAIVADSTVDLIEDISPTGTYFRINLRRFKYEGGKPELLCRAIAESAAEAGSDTAEFIAHWQTIVELIESQEVFFDQEQTTEFTESIARAGYPIIHHSDIYLRKYMPSYRVVSRKYWDKIAPEVFQ